MHILCVFSGPLVFPFGEKYRQNQAEATWLFKTESRKTIPSRLVSDLRVFVWLSAKHLVLR